jgi:hypothetical protein
MHRLTSLEGSLRKNTGSGARNATPASLHASIRTVDLGLHTYKKMCMYAHTHTHKVIVYEGGLKLLVHEALSY